MTLIQAANAQSLKWDPTNWLAMGSDGKRQQPIAITLDKLHPSQFSVRQPLHDLVSNLDVPRVWAIEANRVLLWEWKKAVDLIFGVRLFEWDVHQGSWSLRAVWQEMGRDEQEDGLKGDGFDETSWGKA